MVVPQTFGIVLILFDFLAKNSKLIICLPACRCVHLKYVYVFFLLVNCNVFNLKIFKEKQQLKFKIYDRLNADDMLRMRRIEKTT